MADEPILHNSHSAYVYEIIVDDIVRYIGKGTGSRFKDHVRLADKINRRLKVGAKVKRSFFYKKLSQALNDGAFVEHRVVAFGLTNEAAFAKEIEEIEGASEGQLWNEAPGGNGQSSEYLKKIWSDSERRESLRKKDLKIGQKIRNGEVLDFLRGALEKNKAKW